MFTVCFYGLGTTVNILRRPCESILSCGRIYTDIQRLSEFAFFLAEIKAIRKIS